MGQSQMREYLEWSDWWKRLRRQMDIRLIEKIKKRNKGQGKNRGNEDEEQREGRRKQRKKRKEEMKNPKGLGVLTCYVSIYCK